MAEKTKQKAASKTGTATLEFDEFELNSTMQEFLKEEEKDTGKSIWNIATISGMVMIFLAFTFIIQTIGLPTGEFLSGLTEGLIGSSVLPLIGGALITLVGFGFLVGDRKRAKKIKKARKKSYQPSHKESYGDIHGSEDSGMSSGSRLNNALDRDRNKATTSSSQYSLDSYGYRHSKKLMKSRSDKKISGVCGGLAKYFGISSTVVRFIFAAAFIMGWGASLLVYIGLAIAMPKEPIELMDDFDF
ncbi:PspC domain-containing protein [Gracilimonas amylolytica]|uniref:PspC domain-containing protein n=1 Tax=Gracilimonas amylolytica TaxID=1749045 RepID=UPI000CD7FCCF|nr:PspC domain-containing protein [Gracilimonas amylolytica]